jgi:hypothetical protein
MTLQDVGDADVLPDLLGQLPPDTPVDIVGGDGPYDTKSCHAAIAATGAQPSIPPREGASSWPEATPGAAWRNAAIGTIGKSSRREWKKSSGYHRRSLVENLMYRPKTLTGHCLWARARGRLSGDRGGNPRGRAQPHGCARPPAVRPYRLTSTSQGYFPAFKFDFCNNAYCSYKKIRKMGSLPLC